MRNKKWCVNISENQYVISKKLCIFFKNQVIGFYVVSDKLILKQYAMDLQIKNNIW